MKPHLYGLIGRKLEHSFSPRFFKEKFEKERINATYELFPMESIESVTLLLNEHPEIKGLNVTIPYKEDVMSLLDEISRDARAIGAVNVIKVIRKDDKTYLKGFNTDVLGFKSSLLPLLKEKPDKALILGTGGASKAVEYALNSLGIENLKVSRKPGKGVITYDGLTRDLVETSKLVVNATPAGTFPDTENFPPFPYEFLTSEHICHDLIYNPAVTSFMKKCSERGAVVKNGLEMLHGQAEEAWKIWQK